MANEITVNLSLSVTKGSIKRNIQPGAIQVDQTGYAYTDETVSVTTSEGTYTNTNIGDEGYVFLRNNTDSGQYIDIGFSTGVYGIRLYSSEVACVRLVPGVTMYHKANSVTQDLQITILEN